MSYHAIGAVENIAFRRQQLSRLLAILESMPAAWGNKFLAASDDRSDDGQLWFPGAAEITQPTEVPGSNLVLWPAADFRNLEAGWNEVIGFLKLGDFDSIRGPFHPARKVNAATSTFQRGAIAVVKDVLGKLDAKLGVKPKMLQAGFPLLFLLGAGALAAGKLLGKKGRKVRKGRKNTRRRSPRRRSTRRRHR